jgi:hypothetical protein
MSKSASSTLVGVAQVIVGLLILLPSGLCTGWGLFGALGSGALDGLPIVLVFGGPFLLGGALLIRAGIRRFREPPD